MSFEDLMKTLQAEYLAALPAKIAQLRTQIAAVGTSDLRESFHKLKGTGKTYGLPEVSELAELVEKICIDKPGVATKAAEHAAALLEAIHQARMSKTQHDLAGDSRFAEIRKLAD